MGKNKLDHVIEHYNQVKKMFHGEFMVFGYAFECYYDIVPVPVFANRLCELLNTMYETDLGRWQTIGILDGVLVIGFGSTNKWPPFIEIVKTGTKNALLFEHKKGFDLVFINLSKIEKICFFAAQKVAWNIINHLKNAGY